MWTSQKWDNYTSSQSATNVFMLHTEETLYFYTLCRFWKKYFKVFNLLNLKCHSAQIHPTTCDCVLFIKIIINLHFLTVLPPSSIVLSYLSEVIQNPSSQSITEAYLTCFTASWIQYLLVLFWKYKNKSAHCWLLMLHTCLCLQLEAQSTSAFVPPVLYEFLHVSLCEPGRRVENKTFIAEAVVFVSLLSLWRKCFSVHSSLRCWHRTECVFFLYTSVLRGYLVWLYDFSSSTLL